MDLIEGLIHLLIPRESNNHKAKILHSSSLFIVAACMIIFQGFINYLPQFKPSILGYASQISPEEVIRLTNVKRIEAGLNPLSFNQTLASAAYTKGRDMIDRDYWAHVAPDGTQPWSFFSRFGYRYRYAGENLARDFSSASAAVDAWMNSPSHRDNMLNAKYKEIGIGVVEGDLAGVDTTIIVQFFGSTYADRVVEPIADKASSIKPESRPIVVSEGNNQEVDTQTPSPSSTDIPVPFLVLASPIPTNQAVVLSAPETQQVLISPFNTTRTLSISVLGVLLLIYLVDSFLVSKRRITRIAGKTFAHIAFLGMILMIALILKAGKIL